MAVLTPPYVLQGGSHPAATFRLIQQAQMGSPTGSFAGGISPTTQGGGHGVCSPADLIVTQNGTPNMSVNVGAGPAFIRGTESASQGVYGGYNDATVNLAVAASDPTNPRRDLVGFRVRDSFYSGASNDLALVVVTGTAAAVPVDPTPPANFLVLYRINVAAAATTIVNGNLVDLRTRAAALGAPVPCTSTTRPTGAALVVGMLIYETDTFKVMQYQSATTGWTPPWNMPWGVQGQSAISGNSGAVGGATGVLSAPAFTAVANRRYRITISYGGSIQVGAGSSEVQIRRGTGTTLVTSARNVAAGTVPGCSYVCTDVPGAGSVTYYLYMFTNATSIQLQSNYEIVVEDIGPSANPA